MEQTTQAVLTKEKIEELRELKSAIEKLQWENYTETKQTELENKRTVLTTTLQGLDENQRIAWLQKGRSLRGWLLL